MSRKIYFWILPLASAFLFIALDRAATCSAKPPDKTPAASPDEDDWEAPPPGPRNENPPPKDPHRRRNQAEKNHPPEGMAPPQEQGNMGRGWPHGHGLVGRPEGGPQDGQPRGMMPPEGAFPGGPPQGPEGDLQGPPQGAVGPQMPGGMHPGMPGGNYPLGSRGGARGYGRMWGPFFGGGGFAFSPEQDPEMLELANKERDLETKVDALADEFRRAEGEKKEKIKTELRENLTKQFELRQDRRRKELKRLEEGLKRMNETIERRDKAREQIINRHLSELLGEEDELRF
jgi:hypothetical protein